MVEISEGSGGRCNLVFPGVNCSEQEIFKNFQATTVTIESLQSSPPSLTRFNIQASVTKIMTSESRESPQ